MEKRKFLTALNRARKDEQELSSRCDDLAIMFQPFFDEEISVLFQSSDGFVILHGDGDLNTEVSTAFDEIRADQDVFK